MKIKPGRVGSRVFQLLARGRPPVEEVEKFQDLNVAILKASKSIL